MKLLNLKLSHSNDVIGMASASLSAKSIGHCYVSITLQNRKYKQVKLTVLEELCTDIILGTDFQEMHESITINYGGNKPALTFSTLTVLKTEPPTLFAHLSADCKPIATKSRKYTQSDRVY